MTSEEAKKKYGYTDAGRVTVDGETLTSAGSILSARIFCDILNEQATEIERLKVDNEQQEAVLKVAFDDAHRWGNEAKQQSKENTELRQQLDIERDTVKVLRSLRDSGKRMNDEWMEAFNRQKEEIERLKIAEKEQNMYIMQLAEERGEALSMIYEQRELKASLSYQLVEAYENAIRLIIKKHIWSGTDHWAIVHNTTVDEVLSTIRSLIPAKKDRGGETVGEKPVEHWLDEIMNCSLEPDKVQILVDHAKKAQREQTSEIKRLKAENESKAIAMKDDLKKLNQLLSENVTLRRQLAKVYERCAEKVKECRLFDTISGLTDEHKYFNEGIDRAVQEIYWIAREGET